MTKPDVPPLLIRPGRLIDPAHQRDGAFDLLIEAGVAGRAAAPRSARPD